jgi:hypothetical protein
MSYELRVPWNVGNAVKAAQYYDSSVQDVSTEVDIYSDGQEIPFILNAKVRHLTPMQVT